MNSVHTISSFKQKVFDLMGDRIICQKKQGGISKTCKKGKR
jgi:hypothetical protein